MFRKIYITLMFLLCSLAAFSYTQLSDDAEISLLTCTPGEQLYSCYGHTAIRVKDPYFFMDITFNYGLFDFAEKDFYIRFLKGETWYQLGAESMNDFTMQCRFEQRHIYEQVLRLNADQRQAIWEALLVNYEPQNRKYLYNFVYNNCATRPFHLIAENLGDSITSTYTGSEGVSFRKFIRHYTGCGTWADFGINLLFGPKADVPMKGDERLFLPEELMFYMDGATYSNGEKLVSAQLIHEFQPQKVAWYKSSYFGLALLALALILLTQHDRRRKKLSLWVDIILIIIELLIVALVAFLTFCSLHPLVGFGWRLLIIPAIHLCTRIIYFIK